MIRTYTELMKLDTFEERFRYLMLKGLVCEETFGYERYLNQQFYKSDEWRRLRDRIIIRDNGCDLGMEGMSIGNKVLIHHMNPIDRRDILEHSDLLINPEYLICVSYPTHNAIHYGNENYLFNTVTERSANDTCPWRK